MSKHRKTLAKLLSRPPPADLKWDDLRSFLEHLGYRMLTGSGSRRKFFHEAKDHLICCHEPHPSPDVDKGCIADIVERLKSIRLI